MNRRLFAVLTSVLLAAACSSSGGAKNAPKDDGYTEGVITPAAAKNYPWGQPATVVGENGGQIKVTPLGILYHKGPYTSGVQGPANGWFVAIALRAEAVNKQDDFVAPIGGGGWRWRGQEQTIDTVAGNATSAPWAGSSVPHFGDPIEPGSPEMGVETLDIPVKGGRLLYVAADQSITSWDLPAADTGTGLDKVRARIKEFS